MRGGLAALILLFASTAAWGEAPADFCADRPGLTTGLCLAAPGTFQIETGLFEWSGGDGNSELAIAPSVLRYGLSERSDVHLGFMPYLRAHQDGATHRGVGDLSLAFKHVVANGQAFGIALMPFAKIPTATRPIGNGEWEFGVLLPMEANLGRAWSLTLTPELNWNADEDGGGRHARYAFAATLGVELSDRWSASVDSLLARARDNGYSVREAAVAGALSFLASPTLQIDLQTDIGLARDTPDVAVSTGLSFRL